MFQLSQKERCKFKPIALNLVTPFANSFMLKSCEIQTVWDLSDPKYQDLEYLETATGLFSRPCEITLK